MKHFAILMHPHFTGQQSIFHLLGKLQAEHNVQLFCTPEQRQYFPKAIDIIEYDEESESHPGMSSVPKPQLDCILVFGGDGSILRAKHLALSTGAPILGINLGYLGFLSESTLTDFGKSIKTIIQSKYKLLSRMLLTCSLKRKGKIIFQDLALNDAVIYKAETPKLINVRIYNQGRFVLSTRCDGVIASTPTGSTAYSLSAGGPILAPQMKAMIISPLCPHLLSIRPMVFGAEEKICLRVSQLEAHAWLQIDGVNSCQLAEGDEVLVSAAKKSVSFIKLSNRTFYKILRNKLHLGK